MPPDPFALLFSKSSENAKQPISLGDYIRIRNTIRDRGGRFVARNLLLVNLQTNTCVSAADVLKFKTGTVYRGGKIIDKFWINQKKLNKSQLVSATEAIRYDIKACIRDYGDLFGPEYFNNPQNPLFPSQRPDPVRRCYKPLTYSAYRTMLRQAFSSLNMDLEKYGTHSLKTALPYFYFRKTGDIKGAKALFERKSGRTTITYVETVSLQKAVEIRKECQFFD